MQSPAVSAKPGPAAWTRRAWFAAVALLALAVVAAYWPSLRGGFIWDDDAHVTRPELRSLEGLGRIWAEVGATQQYYPLLHSAFWLEHRLWGDHVLGYHLVNLAQHFAAAVLVMAIVRRLLLARNVPWADGAAWLAGALFALHPVHVESVAWITEQKNTLSALFYLAAMLVYLSFDSARSRGVYALATFLFICGLLTKTVTATLPAALLVIFWWQRAGLSWKKDVLPLLPWCALGAAGGLFTAWVERNLIGAKGEAFDLSLLERFLLGGRVVWFYLAKLAWPAELTFIYPRWTVSASVWWQWLFPLGALALAGGAWLWRAKSRAPLAGLLFFVGTLFPVLGMFNVYPFLFSYVADHFQYLASLGVLTLIAAAVAIVAWRGPAGFIRGAVLAALPLALGALTFNQARLYRDVETLYTTTIARNPACWMAHNNLGVVLRDRARPEEAMEHYRRALALRPAFPEAHNNLGAALSAADRHDEALAHFDEALRLRPANPEALAGAGAALSALGRHREALEKLDLALRYDPKSAALHAASGVALRAAGRAPEAAEAFRRALALNPDQPGVRASLELLEAGALPPAQGAPILERAVRVDPANFEARFGLAVALAQLGRTHEAIAQYIEVVRLRPAHAEARSNLGALLARAGRVAEAVPHFEEAARLRPDLAPLKMNLATALASLGRFDEAIAAAEAARDTAQRAGQRDMSAKIEEWIKATRARAGRG